MIRYQGQTSQNVHAHLWYECKLHIQHQTDIEADKQTETQINRQTDKRTNGQTDRWTDKRTGRWTETGRWTNGQTDRQYTDIDRHRQTKTDIDTRQINKKVRYIEIIKMPWKQCHGTKSLWVFLLVRGWPKHRPALGPEYTISELLEYRKQMQHSHNVPCFHYKHGIHAQMHTSIHTCAETLLCAFCCLQVFNTNHTYKIMNIFSKMCDRNVWALTILQ